MTTFKAQINKLRFNKEMKNLLLFSVGKFISIFGASIYSFAIGLYVLKVTGSALNFATTLILGTIPSILLNPIAGVVSDKVSKRLIVIGMDFLTGTLLVIIYILSSIYGLSLIMVYSTTLLVTMFTTFFNMALETSKPNIVSDNMLLTINSSSKIIDSASGILGPMIAGVVFAFIDIRLFIVINGVCYILSAILECFIDFNFNIKKTSKEDTKKYNKINLINDIKDGFLYLIKNSEIKKYFYILFYLNFFLGFSVSVPLPYIINETLKLSSKNFGIIQGSFPIGMIIGAVIVKFLEVKESYFNFLNKIIITLSLCMILIGLPLFFIDNYLNTTIYLIYYMIVMCLIGICISFIDIPISYIIQIIIPEEYRGRVLSLGLSIVKLMVPISLILSGILLNLVPSFIIPILGGTILFLINIVVLIKNR